MTRRIVAVAVLAAALGAASALAAGVPSPGWQHAGTNRLASVHADGNQADSGSYDPTISADGRIVAFTSGASLVPEDDNRESDVYVRDSVSGTTELVSESYGGGVSHEDYKYSYGAVVSGDGRYVAFMSYARDLTAATSDTVWQQVYVRDLQTDTTELITVTPSGGFNDAFSLLPSISADGRYVAFQTSGALVDADTDTFTDIYLRDRQTQTTTRVTGPAPDGNSTAPEISADGGAIVFTSAATNLVDGDENGKIDTFVWERETGAFELASVSSGDEQANDASTFPDISADGRYVAFTTKADNLVPNDTNGLQSSLEADDVFVRDREAGTTERVSVESSGAQRNKSFGGVISPDGRYVAFDSASEAAQSIGTKTHTWIHDRQTGVTELLSATSGGSAGTGDSGNIELGSGRWSTFDSEAADLAPGDANEVQDVVVRDRGEELGVVGLKVTGGGVNRTVSGRSAFSGQVVSEATDPADDAFTVDAGGELTGASLTYRPEEADLLLRIPVVPGTASTVTYGAELTFRDYRFVVTARPAGNDAAVAQFSLSNCSGDTCGSFDIEGGIGTTGDEVLVSIPTVLMALQTEDVVKARAFSGAVEPVTGEITADDEVALPDFSAPELTVQVGVSALGQAGTGEFSTLNPGGEGLWALPVELTLDGPLEAWARTCMGDVCGPVQALTVPGTVPDEAPGADPVVVAAPGTPALPHAAQLAAAKLLGLDDLSCGDAHVICGTAGADVLTGTAGRDVIVGFGGADLIRGGRGGDVILGGGGDDRVLGGDAGDLLRGGGGADTLDGGRGRDRLYGEAGADKLNGGTGRNRCLGGAGADLLRRC